MARLTGPEVQITDGTSATPVASGNVYFSDPGTTNEKTVYSDSALSTPISQPIALDSEGRFSVDVYGDGAHRMECYDSTDTGSRDGVQVFDADNVRGPLALTGLTLTDQLLADDSTSTASPPYSFDGDADTGWAHPAADAVAAVTGGSERVRINSAGDLLVGKTVRSNSAEGVHALGVGFVSVTRSGSSCFYINRLTDDGELVGFYQDNTAEGNISVSGTTVSYNGAHLSRWSQWDDPSGGRPEVLRGTILSNRDAMARWFALEYEFTVIERGEDGAIKSRTKHRGHDLFDGPLPAGEAVQILAPNGEAVTATVVREANEQLNAMVVSDVPGDPNVAGVFQAYDDDGQAPHDFQCAQTGDFIIRIGAGVSVTRGDLIESAGDGTGRPQEDDIVRSSTIAKITSAHVTCVYGDGSYCVPCVLMAC